VGKRTGVSQFDKPRRQNGLVYACVPWPTPKLRRRPRSEEGSVVRIEIRRRRAKSSHYEIRMRTTGPILWPRDRNSTIFRRRTKAAASSSRPRPGTVNKESFPLLCKFGRLHRTVCDSQPYAGRLRWHQYVYRGFDRSRTARMRKFKLRGDAGVNVRRRPCAAGPKQA